MQTQPRLVFKSGLQYELITIEIFFPTQRLVAPTPLVKNPLLTAIVWLGRLQMMAEAHAGPRSAGPLNTNRVGVCLGRLHDRRDGRVQGDLMEGRELSVCGVDLGTGKRPCRPHGVTR